MRKTQILKWPVDVQAANIGGINETEVSFSPGVAILMGRNATNRTSFLRAIMAALGSESTSLKGDSDEGYVELAVGDDTSRRVLELEGGAVVMGGEPYLGDSEGADLFAFLLKNNEAC
ncbi:ATP-binding protein [Halococcus sp. IIIV-5B]|uniref:ATP-binding protein n=1 Tax=Halococcus sp. IIIV-5B TaxID=2321230 RepID=UPI001F3E0546|nr:ATP-binding protein [Halococcus sp. IIIV-5B]